MKFPEIPKLPAIPDEIKSFVMDNWLIFTMLLSVALITACYGFWVALICICYLLFGFFISNGGV